MLCPGAKEKHQQDGRRGKFPFRIKSHSCQRCSDSPNKHCAHQDPGTAQRLRQNCEHLLWRYVSAVDCHRDRGSGCRKHRYGISPLGQVTINLTTELAKLTQAWEIDSWRAHTIPCMHQDPGERSSDPTRD